MSYSSLSTEINNIDWSGQLLNKNYIIFNKLGNGAFGTVWLCYSLSHKKCYAIKIIHEEDKKSAETEITVLTQTNKNTNNHIINLIDNFEINYSDTFLFNIKEEDEEEDEEDEENKKNNIDYLDEKYICIVIELMNCTSYDILKLYRKHNKKMPLKLVDKIIYTTKESLKQLNKLNYIHSDIKPENILIKYSFNDNNNDTLLHKIIENKNISSLIKKKRKKLNKNKKYDKYTNKLKRIAIKEIVNDLIIMYNKKNNINESEESDDSEESDESDNSSISTDNSYYDYHTVCRSDITSNKSDTDTECKNKKTIFINEEFMLNFFNKKYNELIIKIADLGSALLIKKKNMKYRTIQTRHYRAPEVLLRIPYNKEIDFWSLDCMKYEYLNNKLMFNPEGDELLSTDHRHLIRIHKYVPIYGKNRMYYKHNGLIKL
jgi:serine/threonine-protein kinase SRPK3